MLAPLPQPAGFEPLRDVKIELCALSGKISEVVLGSGLPEDLTTALSVLRKVAAGHLKCLSKFVQLVHEENELTPEKLLAISYNPSISRTVTATNLGYKNYEFVQRVIFEWRTINPPGLVSDSSEPEQCEGADYEDSSSDENDEELRLLFATLRRQRDFPGGLK